MICRTINGNALHIPLASNSVQCVITSPPYWGLRDYGTAEWEGGSGDCDHMGPPKASNKSTLKNDGRPLSQVGQNNYERLATVPYSHQCPKCGAIRKDNQLGLEQTPAEYLANMVNVFREVWRVLKDDGTIWVNMGDNFNSGKQLAGMPWRLALALQDDGWILRSDIIWHKPNPMPESVTDRPTKSHEYVFLLSKRGRYYYDGDAIREAQVDEYKRYLTKRGTNGKYENQNHKANHLSRDSFNPKGRNKRTVWTVATAPYSGSHFATFPPKLIEPMILAGSKPGDTVLDIFAGTSTVGTMAIKHNRSFVGIELNPDYIKLAQRRTANLQPMLIGVG